MADLPTPTRTGYFAIAFAAGVAILGFSSASGLLTDVGSLALMAVGPIALLLVVLVGLWSGAQYVWNRSWQD